MKLTSLVTFTNRAGEQMLAEAVFRRYRKASTREPTHRDTQGTLNSSSLSLIDQLAFCDIGSITFLSVFSFLYSFLLNYGLPLSSFVEDKILASDSVFLKISFFLDHLPRFFWTLCTRNSANGISGSSSSNNTSS